MPRFRKTVPIDDYVFDVLMRDLVGHDQQPGAFLVYLHLYRASERQNWRPVTRSLRAIAEGTGLSKSAVQMALRKLRRRELIESTSAHATAAGRHRVLRHWRQALASTPPRRKRKERVMRAIR
jgi:DNA-binding transcriptional MocR family regulator